jgi:hypothetical protein
LTNDENNNYNYLHKYCACMTNVQKNKYINNLKNNKLIISDLFEKTFIDTNFNCDYILAIFIGELKFLNIDEYFVTFIIDINRCLSENIFLYHPLTKILHIEIDNKIIPFVDIFPKFMQKNITYNN